MIAALRRALTQAWRRLSGKPGHALEPLSAPSAEQVNELCRLGKTREAELLLREATRERRNADAARLLGVVCAAQDRYEDAAAALRGALAIQPGHAETANFLGVCLSMLRRYDEAVACYDAAIAVDATLADAWLNAGWTLSLLGRKEAGRYFRQWLRLATAAPAAGGLAAARGRLKLPEVTLCAVDCAYHDLAARALRSTLAQCEFGAALFLSDRDCGVPGVRFVPIDGITSLAAYSNFVVHRLHEHVRTGHVLVIQHDGYVLNAGAWDPQFLHYDYIGPAVRLPDGRAGGIGGFSLRSRKLLQALRDDPVIRTYDAFREPCAEDVAICCLFRDRLEARHGIRFAPGDLADRFAAEAIAPTTRTFGFHNLMHLVCLYQNDFKVPETAADAIRIALRATSPLGAISVPTQIELRARGDLWSRYLPER